MSTEERDSRKQAVDVNQNIETIASLRARAESDIGPHQRGIERVTAALGRPRSSYVALAVVAGWALFNVYAPRFGLNAFDPPPWPYLQSLVGLSALLMTIMVLTTQNRQTKHAEQRSHLDLQVNLSAEQKIAKLVALVEELRRDIPIVPNRVDPVADLMSEPLDPSAIMIALEQTFDATADNSSGRLSEDGATVGVEKLEEG